MTTEEILLMPAGRQLDAAVAERVMGWAFNGSEWYTGSEVGFARKCWYDRTTGKYSAGEKWSPSTDIAAAWRVVERMQALGYLDPRGPQSCRWWNFWKAAFFEGDCRVLGGLTAQQAAAHISRAALAAVVDSQPGAPSPFGRLAALMPPP